MRPALLAMQSSTLWKLSFILAFLVLLTIRVNY